VFVVLGTTPVQERVAGERRRSALAGLRRARDKIADREDTFSASYRALHHELSSFVLKHDNDTYADWLALEPAGWHFSETREDELVRAAQAAPDPATGFISGLRHH
jgi:hypothetical protein